MKMTLEEYIRNPMGKNNAVYSQRELFKELYTKKFDAVFAREAGKMVYQLYKDSDDHTRYYMYIKVPSETVSKFYYDIVIEFTTNDPVIAAESSLNNYDVKFYSNDPAFVYTYAYSFSKNNLFIEDLKPKMSKIALSEKAKVRNPKNLVGYVKTIYFAYLFIKLRGLDKKAVLLTQSIKYNKRDLLEQIEDADKKIEDREIKGKEKTNKDRAKKEKKEPTTKHINTLSAKKSSMVNNIHTSNTAKTIKKVGYIKTTKRK